MTVITPVFDAAGGEILFYVGSRGHHADIGGSTPGSMPPDSAHIDEEGVLLTDFQLVRGGRMREAELREALAGARWPARNPEQNLADLRAQVAANEKGREELLKMVQHFGLDVVRAYMGHVQDNAEASVRRVIGALKDGAFELPLDNGARICVRIAVDRARRAATVDFGGTSPQQPNNFNAPHAVTMAAVLYVFRTLVDDDIPMNAGCLKPIEVIVPDGSMLNPRYPAAVVAGNVETSQCITNCLYGALGVMASGPPTMSNFTFGNARYQYYETVSGGSGAGGVFDAAGQAGRRVRRHGAGADPHDQLAAHRSGDPRVALPGTARQLPDPRRLGRRRALARRRRRRETHPFPRADDGVDPCQRPGPSGLRRGGRLGRRAGRRLCDPRRRSRRPLAPCRQRRGRGG